MPVRRPRPRPVLRPMGPEARLLDGEPSPLVLLAVASVDGVDRADDAGAGAQAAPGDPSAIGLALLRHLAAEALAVHPAAVRIGHDPAGRPVISGPPGAADLRCSVSHAGRVVAAAVALGCLVGVDVEPVDPRRADLATVGRFVDVGTQERLAAPPPTDRPRSVALAWTRLEAEAKGRGVAVDRLRGRVPGGVATELELAPSHVGTLWTDRVATVRRLDAPEEAGVQAPQTS